MLGWLKRRARLTINSRYISLLRRNISPDMIVPESVQMFNQQSLKLVVLNCEGRDFPLEVPMGTTVERIKTMAVGHFFNPLDLADISVNDDKSDLSKPGNKSRTYRLVLVREARPLLDVNSLQLEQIIDNDELLLVEGREHATQREATPEETASPTITQIVTATKNLVKRNHSRDPDPANHSTDFQIEFRRILITMIEASIRLISADPDSEEIFTQILEKLERRHRPRVDKNALRQLMDMGFPEAEATKALHAKRNVMEATEWLLEQGNRSDAQGNDGEGNATEERMLTEPAVTTAAALNVSSDEYVQDPAKRILNTFLQYHRKWFQPDRQALQGLVMMGFSEEKVIEALRCSGNKQDRACELLLNANASMPDDRGLERDSPIISAILASPVIQLALPKPKTLLALMMLFESPNNANMWLSDPDTHPVVSQVLRIYHAEKHSLNPNRPLASTPQPSADSPSANRGLVIRVNTSGNASPMQQQPQLATVVSTQAFPLGLRSVSSNGIPGIRSTSASVVPGEQPPYLFSMSPSSMRRPSPVPMTASSPRVIASPNTTPVLIARTVRLNAEDSMSHSGSPVRAPGGPRNLSDSPAERRTYNQSAETVTQDCARPMTSLTRGDVEMVDVGNEESDSQDMDTK